MNLAGGSWHKDRNRVNQIYDVSAAAALPGSRNGLANNKLGFEAKARGMVCSRNPNGVEANSGFGEPGWSDQFSGSETRCEQGSEFSTLVLSRWREAGTIDLLKRMPPASPWHEQRKTQAVIWAEQPKGRPYGA